MYYPIYGINTTYPVQYQPQGAIGMAVNLNGINTIMPMPLNLSIKKNNQGKVDTSDLSEQIKKYIKQECKNCNNIDDLKTQIKSQLKTEIMNEIKQGAYVSPSELEDLNTDLMDEIRLLKQEQQAQNIDISNNRTEISQIKQKLDKEIQRLSQDIGLSIDLTNNIIIEASLLEITKTLKYRTIRLGTVNSTKEKEIEIIFKSLNILLLTVNEKHTQFLDELNEIITFIQGYDYKKKEKKKLIETVKAVIDKIQPNAVTVPANNKYYVQNGGGLQFNYLNWAAGVCKSFCQ